MSKPKERPFAATPPGAAPSATPFIALLRGINVGGNKKIPMAELREIAGLLGWDNVQSYIQSGNLVFSASVIPSVVELALERTIQERFGFAVDVVVRTSGAWQAYAAGSPFGKAEEERPHLLHLGLSKRPPKPDAVETLRRYAAAGERVEVFDDAIWIDFAGGVARSRLTPAVLDRAVGSTVTARNWRTVQKLGEMARAIA